MANAMIERHERSGAGVSQMRRQDCEQIAMEFVRAALCLNLRDSLAATAPAEWEAGLELLESDFPWMQQRGIIYLLRVLARTPHNGRSTAQALLAELDNSHVERLVA